MIDRHLMEQMENVLSRLSTVITIVDKDADNRTPDMPLLPSDLTDGVTQVVGEGNADYFMNGVPVSAGEAACGRAVLRAHGAGRTGYADAGRRADRAHGQQ